MKSIETFNQARESEVTSRFCQMMSDRKAFLDSKKDKK